MTKAIRAHHRRHFHGVILLIWLLPLAPVTWLLRDNIAWVSFMSWFAILYACAGAWSAETPVEEE